MMIINKYLNEIRRYVEKIERNIEKIQEISNGGKHVKKVKRPAPHILIDGYNKKLITVLLTHNFCGIRGDWVSSIALNKLINDHGVSISNNEFSKILRELGYVPHPYLKGGRTNTKTPIDDGKPRLYIKLGSPWIDLEYPPKITQQYVKDQSLAEQRIAAKREFEQHQHAMNQHIPYDDES